MTETTPDVDQLPADDVDQDPADIKTDGAPDEAPEPFLRGRFALYATPGGGIHLATYTDQHGEQHKDFPPMMVRMMTGGKLAKMLGLGGKLPGADDAH